MTEQLPSIEVCLSPALLHLYDTTDKIVVIIDVFRATSTIAAALHNGAESVLPVASVAECIELGTKIQNSITAGERDGKVAEGLQYGNSPTEYPSSFIAGKTLILTTTNGTRLLHMVSGHAEIITGSFLNLTAVCDYLVSKKKSVILGCAAWKDKYNLEDALFAGAVAKRTEKHFDTNCDSTRSVKYLYEASQKEKDIISFLRDSAHYRRLSAYGLQADMEYCATPDLHPVVPVLRGDKLIAE